MPKRIAYTNGPSRKRFRRGRRFIRRRVGIRRISYRRRGRFSKTRVRRFNQKGIKIFTIPTISSDRITFDVVAGVVTPTLVNLDTRPLSRSYEKLTDILQTYQRLKLLRVTWAFSNFKLQNKIIDTSGSDDVEIEDLRSFAIWMYQDKWNNGIPSGSEMQEVSMKRNVTDGTTRALFFGDHKIPNSGSLAASDLPPAGTSLVSYLETIKDTASLISADGVTQKFYNLRFVFFPQINSEEVAGEDHSYILSFSTKITAVWSASKLQLQ